MMKERRMMTGLMSLTFMHVLLIEVCIAGWEKLHRKQNQQNHLQEAVRVSQIRGLQTPEYQRVHLDQDYQSATKLSKEIEEQVKVAELMAEEWSSGYGNERKASKDSGQS